MHRKRLQHAADILCHMFCGWRLINSYADLERLGSGTLTIDALTGRCAHNDVAIPSLSIAGELQAWLAGDLSAHHIDSAGLREAALTAQLAFSHVPRTARVTHDTHFAPAGLLLDPERYLRCDIACTSRVVTDDRSYESRYQDIEEWPPGFTTSSASQA
jgi:hypothetical protein